MKKGSSDLPTNLEAVRNIFKISTFWNQTPENENNIF